MQIAVSWQGEAAFLGKSGSGHEILMDGPSEGGGRDRGARPMEMLLLGMAACSSYDVISILHKSRQEVASCNVEVNAKRADNYPQVFTDIHMHFVLTGTELQTEKVRRAIQLSAEKYCSASIMLGKMANITHDYEVLEGAAER